MDTDATRKALGDGGLAGTALALFGIAVLTRENRRIALGAVAILLGSGLITHGLVESFLESMGMEFEDLY
jgi:hypothetical protein